MDKLEKHKGTETEVVVKNDEVNVRRPKPRLYHKDDKYFQAVEADSEIAQEKINLHNEVIMLRTQLMELHEKIKTGEEIVAYYRQDGMVVPMGDKEKGKMLMQLARAIAGLAKTDYDISLVPGAITADDFVMWLGKLARAVRALEDEGIQETFVNVMRDVGLPKQQR